MSESSRDIKGITLEPVRYAYKRRRGTFDLDSASQRQFPLLPPKAAWILFETDTEKRNLGARCIPRPVATDRVICVCDWWTDVTGLDFGDRS